MVLYECIVIARQDLSQSQVDAITENCVRIITESKGKVEKQEYCGLRTLAYPIRKNKKGHYVLMNVTSDSAAVKEVERQLRLNEDVLRYLTIAVEEHDAEPSALLKSSRRDGRREYSSYDRDEEGAGEGTPSTENESAPSVAGDSNE